VKLDLNCDLGEGEPLARTGALMRRVTSANVACGGHGGDLKTMEACVRLAWQHGVRLGAHPGPWSRSDFGRGSARFVPDEIELLLLHQVGALERVAQANGVRLHHIKLHGALYHASEENEALAKRYVAAVRRFWPQAKIYARVGGRVARVARRAGLVLWEEAFADRSYRDDGTLVPRTEPNALLTEADLVVERVRRLLDQGEVIAESGKHIVLRPQTLCIHSDTPHAAQLAQAVGKEIGANSRSAGGGRYSIRPIRGRP
jgi:5-oxoprolinase (ATP-hydrolysing) subunit A